MQIYRSHFGHKLRDRRQSQGFTQAELAEQVGVEPSTVSKWETGKDFPSQEYIKSLTKALAVDQHYFEIVNTEVKAMGFNEAATFLRDYAALDPDIQKVILMILYGDDSYIETVSRASLSRVIKVLSPALKIK